MKHKRASERRRALGVTAGLMALIALSVGASSSSAATPRSFFGVVPQTPLDTSDFERMGTGQVGTVRTIINWSQVDPTAFPFDNNWVTVDPVVLEAARNGIEVLPFIFGTPTWVAKTIDHQKCGKQKCALYAPKSQAALDEWKRFVSQAVERYGPNGEFWNEHPEVPAMPIHAWQLWNEQNSKSFYAPKPSAKGYAKLLAAGSEAIRTRDPSGQVVLGGMAELAGSSKAIPGSEYLADLYKVNGAAASFDGVAPHPYGASIGKVSSQVNLYRKVMKKAHDSGAGMWVTEIGAGSATGGNPLNRGPAGQASLLKQIYKYFLKRRDKLHVQQVDWFSWEDSAHSICSWCASSGLLTKADKAKPSYKAFTKLTGGSPG